MDLNVYLTGQATPPAAKPYSPEQPVAALVYQVPPAAPGPYRMETGCPITVTARVVPVVKRYFEVESAQVDVYDKLADVVRATVDATVEGDLLHADMPDWLPVGIYDLTFTLQSASVSQQPTAPIRLLVRPAPNP